MGRKDEELERTLRRSLEQIEDAADQICRGIGFFDPDRLETALGSEAGPLRDALARLMEEPEPTHLEPAPPAVDLAVLASTLAGLVDSEAATLRLEVAPGELPPAAAGADQLRAAVRRLLQIGVTHAGSGGVVTVEPRTVEGDPALELMARPATGASTAALLPLTARCRSLADFAGDLGGGLELIERDDHEIAALLRFPRSDGAPE